MQTLAEAFAAILNEDTPHFPISCSAQSIEVRTPAFGPDTLGPDATEQAVIDQDIDTAVLVLVNEAQAYRYHKTGNPEGLLRFAQQSMLCWHPELDDHQIREVVNEAIAYWDADE